MIEGLKPYPVMKDSGVPWLGEIPEHWSVAPISRMGALLKGRGGSKEDEQRSGIPCVRYGDLYTRHEFFITSSKGFVSRERAGSYTPIRFGDLLFAASGETIEDIGRSAVNLIDGIAVCGGDVILLRPYRAIDARFLGYAADAPPSRHQKATMGRGFTVVHIYSAELRRLALPIPTPHEQAAIVRFLDHADRRIRRYIRAKQMLIRLLEEQMQAIIDRTVELGVNPEVGFRRSGVKWLQKVPEHWEVRRLKYIAESIQMGPFGASLTQLQARDTGYKLYGQENTISGDFSRGQRWVTAEQFAALQRYELLPGDVVLTRKGSVGKCKLFPSGASPGLADSDTIRVRLDPKRVVDKFIILLLQDVTYVQRQIESMQRGAILAGLNTATIANIELALPPLSEQAMLLSSIESNTMPMAQAIAATHREIDLLREYRARLIADVVTGKLDVREASARLPEEVDESESADELGSDDDSVMTDAEAEAEEVQA